jgi:hypothetical protein
MGMASSKLVHQHEDGDLIVVFPRFAADFLTQQPSIELLVLERLRFELHGQGLGVVLARHFGNLDDRLGNGLFLGAADLRFDALDRLLAVLKIALLKMLALKMPAMGYDGSNEAGGATAA